ncbi:MAG: PDC sensor domain-containing protein [Gammaproteobacteria bacterium]
MTTGIDTLQQSIARQREALGALLHEPLRQLARRCGAVWNDRDRLEAVLADALTELPHCKFIYALNTEAVQITANVSRNGPLETDFGRDRSQRPYVQGMRDAIPRQDFLLSTAYISMRAKRPSLTALQVVYDDAGNALGFVGADFDLRDLPLTRELYEEPRHWRQLRGDPSIRGSVFYQTRAESQMDSHIDTVIGVVEELMMDHGLFHVILHFSSSRAVIWLFDDPYCYRLLDIDALIDPDICLAYPRQTYPDNARVPAAQIRAVLERFRELRFMDETLYLRSGTLNIFNGTVGLTFSCDGSHYIPYDEFLTLDQTFWNGVGGE